MSTSGVSLLQIPEIPMKNILEYLDFASILILRKVCHDLRRFIDDTKPASHLTTIDVNVKLESTISFILETNTFIDYLKQGEGCLVKCYKESQLKETILEGENFFTVFCKDFDIMLRHQKTVLEEFRIRFNLSDSMVKENILESVNKSLKSMNHLLQVKSLYMEVNNHNEILPVLPYMDPKSLKEIHISEYPSRRGNILNVDEIGQLEQWKQADELTISGFQITELSQNIKHFLKVTFRFRPYNNEELILLKGDNS